MSQKRWTVLACLLVVVGTVWGADNSRKPVFIIWQFENKGEVEDYWLGPGLSALIDGDLREVNGLVPYPGVQGSGVGEQKGMRENSKERGADFMICGSYKAGEEKVEVEAHLVETKRGRMIKTLALSAPRAELFALEDKIVLALLKAAADVEVKGVRKVLLKDSEVKCIQRVPTTNFKAFEEFARGDDMQGHDPRKALEHLEQAIALDGDYYDALYEAGYLSARVLSDFENGLGYLAKAEALCAKNQAWAVRHVETLMAIGGVCDSAAQHDKAIQHHLKASGIVQDRGLQDTYLSATLNRCLATSYWNKRDLDLALASLQDARSAHQALGLDKTMLYAGVLTRTGYIYHQQLDYDKAYDYYALVLKLMTELNAKGTTDYLNMLTSFAIVCEHLDHPELARKYLNEVKNTLANLPQGGTPSHAHLMFGIGEIYQTDRNPLKALEYYRRSKKLMDKFYLGGTYNYAVLMKAMGDAYRDRRNYVEAKKHHRQARDIYENLGQKDTLVYGGTVVAIGMDLESEKRVDLALSHYLDYLAIKDKHGEHNTLDYSYCCSRIGDIHLGAKKASLALPYYEEAKKILEALGEQEKIEYAFMLYKLGDTYEKRGRDADAGKMFAAAHQLFMRLGWKGSERDAARKRAKFLQRK